MTAQATQTRNLVTNEFKQQQQRVDRNRLLHSLKFPDMNARRNQWTIDGDENTLNWVFKEDETLPWDCFPSWLKSNRMLYWIYGKPGSGKSTLMKRLVSDIRTVKLLEQWHQNPLILSHFFWLNGSLLQRTKKGLLCSLLYQILDARMDQLTVLVDLETSSRKEHVEDWSEQELKDCLLKCLSGSPDPMVLFLDGLDELDPEEGHDTLIQFIALLKKIPNVKMCISSRSEREFIQAYGQAPKMKLQALTKEDIKIVVSKNLRESFKFTWDDEKRRKKLIDVVVGKSDGVFLWVHLALKSLQRGGTRSDDWTVLEGRLDALPSKLEDLYRTMWRRLGDDEIIYRQKAAFYLKLLLSQEDRVLSLFSMAFAGSEVCKQGLEMPGSTPKVNELVQQCEAHIQKIEDYSAGFLEFGTTEYDIVEMKYYPFWVQQQVTAVKEQPEEATRLQALQKKLLISMLSITVRFIHRTAIDFLQDTHEGQAILAADHTPDDELHSFIVETKLFSVILGAAECLIDFIIDCNGRHFQLTSRLLRYGETTFFELLDRLELLHCKREKNIDDTTQKIATIAFQLIHKYCVSLVLFGYLPALQRVFALLDKRGQTVTKPFVSYVLLCVCETRIHSKPLSRPLSDCIVWLISLGADSNFTQQLRWRFRRMGEYPLEAFHNDDLIEYCLRRSTFVQFLLSLLRSIQCFSSTNLELITTSLEAFIAHGVNVNDKFPFSTKHENESNYQAPSSDGPSCYLPRGCLIYIVWEINAPQAVLMVYNACAPGNTNNKELVDSLFHRNGYYNIHYHTKPLLICRGDRNNQSLISLQGCREWFAFRPDAGDVSTEIARDLQPDEISILCTDGRMSKEQHATIEKMICRCEKVHKSAGTLIKLGFRLERKRSYRSELHRSGFYSGGFYGSDFEPEGPRSNAIPVHNFRERYGDPPEPEESSASESEGEE